MKKLALLLVSFVFCLLAVAPALAAPGPLDTGITVAPPAGRAVNPNTQLNTIIQNAITIAFIAAALVVLVMLIIGAFQWIVSGGDKEAVGKARGRIVNALIGLAILALAFLILSVVGQLLNINILGGKIPSLTSAPTTTGQ